MSRICVIVGAGDRPVFRQKYNNDEYLIIAADGGYEYLKEEGMRPDIWIGDLDSSEIQPESAELQEKNVRLVRLPCEKDDTDTFAAVKLAMEKGCDEFHIYGATGGRLDHTLANIKVLSYLASVGKRGWVYSSTETVTAFEDSSITLAGQEHGYVSVFSLTDVSEGVDIAGLKYTLDNGRLLGTDQIGVSNEFIGTGAVISVKKGRLLVTYQDRIC